MNHSNCFYNPDTNELVTNASNSFDFNREGFINVGCRKLAEALTTVSKEDRVKVWKSFRYGTGIVLSKLNSKLRHKMKKRGITRYNEEFVHNPLLKQSKKKF